MMTRTRSNVEPPRNPHILRAVELLRRLLPNGASLPGKLVRELADAERIQPWQLERAVRYLGVVIEKTRRPSGVGGKSLFGPTNWSLPAKRSTTPVAPPPRRENAPLPAPPDHLRDQCIRIGGRWTHALGDEEYRRLLDGGAPHRTPFDPELRQRPRSTSWSRR